jgi:putative SOS response-associated peptidase YedK
MCGRTTITVQNVDLLAEALGVPVDAFPADYQPHFNLAPTQDFFVLREHHERREILPAKWGLVNFWSKDKKRASLQINARADGIENKPAYREAFKRRRCIVPVDGFYEWYGDKKARQPFWFHRPDGKLLLMAGLYESWQAEPGAALQHSFTIITTEANELIAHIHDRMPVILAEEDIDKWLYEGEKDMARLKGLLVPAANDIVVPRAVGREVNDARFDTASMIEPIDGVEYPYDSVFEPVQSPVQASLLP